MSLSELALTAGHHRGTSGPWAADDGDAVCQLSARRCVSLAAPKVVQCGQSFSGRVCWTPAALQWRICRIERRITSGDGGQKWALRRLTAFALAALFSLTTADVGADSGDLGVMWFGEFVPFQCRRLPPHTRFATGATNRWRYHHKSPPRPPLTPPPVVFVVRRRQALMRLHAGLYVVGGGVQVRCHITHDWFRNVRAARGAWRR